ncbi:DUF1648 domain-containing protein [Larkinella harenae]
MKPLFSSTVPAVERFLNAFSVLLLVGQFGLVIGYYIHLPQTIPVHFGLNGQPDRWGGRSTLFVAPAISTGMFFLFWAIRQIPAEFYNMPARVTPENEERQLRNTHEMLAMLLFITMIFMFWTLWDWLRSAENTELVRDKVIPMVFLGASLVGTLAFYLWRAKRQS